MSALSDMLTAAQGRALAALERAYLREMIDGEQFSAACDTMGARDVIERAELLACLDVLREYGATEPANASGQRPARMMSEAQGKLIERLANERGVVAPETAGLTMSKASELITQLQRGTYDPDAWDVPF